MKLVNTMSILMLELRAIVQASHVVEIRKQNNNNDGY